MTALCLPDTTFLSRLTTSSTVIRCHAAQKMKTRGDAEETSESNSPNRLWQCEKTMRLRLSWAVKQGQRETILIRCRCICGCERLTQSFCFHVCSLATLNVVSRLCTLHPKNVDSINWIKILAHGSEKVDCAFLVLWPLKALHTALYIHPFTQRFIHWCRAPNSSSGAIRV